MHLKYIMLRKNSYNKPIFFLEPTTHVGIYEALSKHPEFKEMKLVSAGFYNTDTEEAYGKSESLRLAGYLHCRSRPKRDSKIISRFDMLHGIE